MCEQTGVEWVAKETGFRYRLVKVSGDALMTEMLRPGDDEWQLLSFGDQMPLREILRLSAELAQVRKAPMAESWVETDLIGGEDVPRPDIDTVRRWIGTAREEGYLRGVSEAEEKLTGIRREAASRARAAGIAKSIEVANFFHEMYACESESLGRTIERLEEIAVAELELAGPKEDAEDADRS